MLGRTALVKISKVASPIHLFFHDIDELPVDAAGREVCNAAETIADGHDEIWEINPPRN